MRRRVRLKVDTNETFTEEDGTQHKEYNGLVDTAILNLPAAKPNISCTPDLDILSWDRKSYLTQAVT